MATTDNGKSKSGVRKWMIILVLLILVVNVVTLLVFNFTYSEGNRAGTLMKFSHKGFMFKTYEGELNVGGIGNVAGTAQANQIWYFSVNDQPVADSLMNMEGKKVSLHYRQVVKNTFWQGDTKYFVDGYKVLP